ncbi:hypothetical protein MARI151_40099 [Maribacter litoralis]|uniref:Uncharacterized protein n=1 Tax=Maribacter litoralis TaxID=2059726 RepID=A0A653U9Y0_9FLAO|nr:hypothetical protein MARI151_40099 [Maribacter litoralis]
MQINRNTPTIISSGYGIIFIYDYANAVTMTTHSLINRVINYFIYQMVQTTDPNITYIHGWTHTYVLHSLQGLNTICRIIFLICFFAHKIKVVLLQILQSYKYTQYPMKYSLSSYWAKVSYQQLLWKIRGFTLKNRTNNSIVVKCHWKADNKTLCSLPFLQP